jgi:hypothetical protein
VASLGELGDELRHIASDLPLCQFAEALGHLQSAHQRLAHTLKGSTRPEAPRILALLAQAIHQIQQAHQLGIAARTGLETWTDQIGTAGLPGGGRPVTPGTGAGRSNPPAGEAPAPPAFVRRQVDAGLVTEVRRQGHKISPEKVVRIGRDRTGRPVWLEDGNQSRGLTHILEPNRQANFIGIGIAAEDIVDVVFEAATKATPIGLSGQDRPVFVVNYRGQPKRIAVTVSANGFIEAYSGRSTPDRSLQVKRAGSKIKSTP